MSLEARLSKSALLRAALYNARRMAKTEFKRRPNWVLAMELWGVGSTYASRLCELADVDPQGLEFQLWPFSAKVVADESARPSPKP